MSISWPRSVGYAPVTLGDPDFFTRAFAEPATSWKRGHLRQIYREVVKWTLPHPARPRESGFDESRRGPILPGPDGERGRQGRNVQAHRLRREEKMVGAPVHHPTPLRTRRALQASGVGPFLGLGRSSFERFDVACHGSQALCDFEALNNIFRFEQHI